METRRRVAARARGRCLYTVANVPSVRGFGIRQFSNPPGQGTSFSSVGVERCGVKERG